MEILRKFCSRYLLLGHKYGSFYGQNKNFPMNRFAQIILFTNFDIKQLVIQIIAVLIYKGTKERLILPSRNLNLLYVEL